MGVNDETMSEDEKRARAYKAYLTAQENYLLAAGWVKVEVNMPVDDFEMGPGTRHVSMWADEHEVKNKKLRQLRSTKLALEYQEEIDGYRD
jgi:hypothetical protein